MKNVWLLALASTLIPSVALADEPTTTDEPATATSAPNDGTPLPPPQSDDDPAPPVAAAGSAGLVQQAGVGGNTAYGRAGVLELGGSAGFRIGDDFTTVNVAPSVGWFVADNLQLSAILDVAHVSTDGQDATVVTALAEPSYHLPFTRGIFGFLGLGIGGSYVTDLGGGFAMTPRLGANFLVGRSGLLTPSVSWQYTTQDTMDDAESDSTTIAVSSAVRFNVGYTVMW